MSELSEQEAFHAAIWKAPDDDLPRLVYADWLDERGEPDAAAFLRLLCAVRTCPPDVDRLRPLVADFRRAMVKVHVTRIDKVCPIPPAVVVGAWVDVDHEANRGVLEYLRSHWTWREFAGVRPTPAAAVSWTIDPIIQRVWHELAPALGPSAACVIGGPGVIDVWSGVVLAVALGEMDYVIRAPRSEVDRLPTIRRSRLRFEDDGWWLRIAAAIGPDWIGGREHDDEIAILRRAAAEFDPANRPA